MSGTTSVRENDGAGWRLCDRGSGRGRSYRVWRQDGALTLTDLTRAVSTIRARAAAGAVAVPLVLECLDDASTTIRAAAADALGDTGSLSAPTALAGRLAKELENPTREVMEATLNALGNVAGCRPRTRTC
jgi:HEAT repeat protein